MNKRIKQLRKGLNLTQKKFGERLGVSEGAVSNIEKEKRNVTDQMFNSVCREFNVNEEWLRTGNGNMFVQPKENELTKQAAVLLRQGDPLFEAFVKYYLLLDTDGREAILKIAKDFSNHFAAELKAKESGEH